MGFKSFTSVYTSQLALGVSVEVPEIVSCPVGTCWPVVWEVIFTPNGACDDGDDGDGGSEGDDGIDCTPPGAFGAIWASECKFPPLKLSIQKASVENSKTKESLFKIIPPFSSPL